MQISPIHVSLHAILSGTTAWLLVTKPTLIVYLNVIMEVEIALATALVWKTVRTDVKPRDSHISSYKRDNS